MGRVNLILGDTEVANDNISFQWDVACMGNAMVDIFSSTTDQEIKRMNLIPGSMQLMDRETAKKLYQSSSHDKVFPGGSAANTAVGIASFGGKVKLIGKIKNDLLGKFFYNAILKENVNLVTKVELSGLSTGQSYILISHNERTMYTYLGAASKLSVDDIDNSQIIDCKILFVEGYLWDKEKTKQAALKAIDIADKNGIKIAFTLSDQDCIKRHRDDFRSLIFTKVDVLFGNKKEAFALFEVSNLNAVIQATQEKCKIAVFTLGDEGSIIISKDKVYRIEPDKLNVEDTTGAGDLYAAGVLFGLSKNMALEECARLGGIAAAENVTHLGAHPKVRLKQLL